MSKYKSGTKKYLRYIIEHTESNTDSRLGQSECRFQSYSLPCELENSLVLSMSCEPCPLMRAQGPGSARLDICGPHVPHLTVIQRWACSIPDTAHSSGLLGFRGPFEIPNVLFWTFAHLAGWNLAHSFHFGSSFTLLLPVPLGVDFFCIRQPCHCSHSCPRRPQSSLQEVVGILAAIIPLLDTHDNQMRSSLH